MIGNVRIIKQVHEWTRCVAWIYYSGIDQAGELDLLDYNGVKATYLLTYLLTSSDESWRGQFNDDS